MKNYQKQALGSLESLLTGLESDGEESIVNNPRGLLMLLYLERVADFCRGYPDTPSQSRRVKAKQEKNYQALESLRARIVAVAQKLSEEQRQTALKAFNDTTAVSSTVSGLAGGVEDKRSSKEFVDEWIEKHPKN